MECLIPSINTNDGNKLKDIFSTCKRIAIVGLSPDPTKDSHKVAKYLQEHGFKIYPIYPKEDMILGEKVYRTITEITEPIDMVDMFRKADIANSLIEEVIQRGDIKVFWLQLGIVNDPACEIAQKNGIIAVQNKCTKLEYERLHQQ
ncbi:MAG: CoA-binding protein [Gudongella sp.]|jgi:predicted CoA-binding protein|nr:CoA-binding protein [Sulfurospirillaceae bacterium]MDD2827746.1 CoA-binding protein [Sulfurospirillaceae bacterium]MDX9918350.1 CoA-binding protein [Gudongella sp.]